MSRAKRGAAAVETTGAGDGRQRGAQTCKLKNMTYNEWFPKKDQAERAAGLLSLVGAQVNMLPCNTRQTC